MNITHYMNNGTRTNSVAGHIVRIADVPEAYEAIKEGERNGDRSDQSRKP